MDCGGHDAALDLAPRHGRSGTAFRIQPRLRREPKRRRWRRTPYGSTFRSMPFDAHPTGGRVQTLVRDGDLLLEYDYKKTTESKRDSLLNRGK